eukprot:TRINITY_DN3932_c0_g1_i2.p1 TRINITY_DN3932_c0_g1~~TRINITY_DN3932_c0_g1_i2.p1  ORF type:complete len:414 (-),score=59.09 TRINITY_DN3932_c0_g1_i2:5-1225(-)
MEEISPESVSEHRAPEQPHSEPAASNTDPSPAPCSPRADIGAAFELTDSWVNVPAVDSSATNSSVPSASDEAARADSITPAKRAGFSWEAEHEQEKKIDLGRLFKELDMKPAAPAPASERVVKLFGQTVAVPQQASRGGEVREESAHGFDEPRGPEQSPPDYDLPLSSSSSSESAPDPQDFLLEQPKQERSSAVSVRDLINPEDPFMPTRETPLRELVGRRVVRGRDWQWGDQDLFEGNTGIVQYVEHLVGEPPITDRTLAGWLRVIWTNGVSNTYRWGQGGAYELRAVVSVGAAKKADGDIGDLHISVDAVQDKVERGRATVVVKVVIWEDGFTLNDDFRAYAHRGDNTHVRVPLPFNHLLHARMSTEPMHASSCRRVPAKAVARLRSGRDRLHLGQLVRGLLRC